MAVLLQVTLLSGATQVSPRGIAFKQMLIQNNAAGNVRVGDSTVSATKGILLTPGSSSNFGAVNIQADVLSDYWLYGTSAQVIDILYIPA